MHAARPPRTARGGDLSEQPFKGAEPGALRSAALEYAAAGLAVFPLRGKAPRTQRGFKDASTDAELIAGWWDGSPDANVGIRTGDGLVVVDIDPRHGGEDTFLELVGEHGVPLTAAVETGGGGQHLYFRPPGGESVASRKLGPGVDLKAEGGYVVAPPSVHPETGSRYRFSARREYAELPRFLLDAEKRRNGSAPPVGDAIPAGARNEKLTSLAGTMRRRGMGEAEILAALVVANEQRCQPPLEREEVESIARSVASYAPHESPFEAGEAPGSIPDRGLDDIGNASRFADAHHKALRYCAAWRRWLWWDGRRWQEDDSLEPLRRARQTARALADEAAAEPDEERRKALLGHARRSAGEPRVRAMLTLAASDTRVVVRPADLDADPWALNTESGTVDLRTGELRPHRPEDHLTMLAGAPYDPEAQAPLWEAHLRRCLVSDELIGFLQRLAGLSALGLVREHILAMLVGGGQNGKTVTMDAIAAALGDYAAASTASLLLQSRRGVGQATPELADLRGRRYVTVSETPEDARLAAERVKWITGGDTITARRLHGNPFSFRPSHTIWLATNHKPRISDDSVAIWRRIRLVPFTVTIPEADRDDEIGEKLAAERPGILRWIVEGARAYLRDGLVAPPEVRRATARYREDEDSFGAFLAERTATEEGASVQASALLKAYNAWATEEGAPALSKMALADKLERAGCKRKRTETGSRWLGLRLIEEGTLGV